MADDDPRVVLDQVEHSLLRQGTDQLVGQVARDLHRRRDDEPLGKGHPDAGEPGIAGERLEDLATDVADAQSFELFRVPGEVERELGLGSIGADAGARSAIRSSHSNASSFGEGRLLGGQFAEVGGTAHLVGRRNRSP